MCSRTNHLLVGILNRSQIASDDGNDSLSDFENGSDDDDAHSYQSTSTTSTAVVNRMLAGRGDLGRLGAALTAKSLSSTELPFSEMLTGDTGRLNKHVSFAVAPEDAVAQRTAHMATQSATMWRHPKDRGQPTRSTQQADVGAWQAPMQRNASVKQANRGNIIRGEEGRMEMFRILNQNKDSANSWLTVDELTNALQNFQFLDFAEHFGLNLHLTGDVHGDAERLMATLDTNKNGRVSMLEFMNWTSCETQSDAGTDMSGHTPHGSVDPITGQLLASPPLLMSTPRSAAGGRAIDPVTGQLIAAKEDDQFDI